MTATMRYSCPENLREAVARLAEGTGSRIVAGGTDLVVELRQGNPPSEVVDVTRIPELSILEQGADDTLRIGAALSHSRIAADPLVRRLAPILCEACASVGSVQIRNLGTLGGNVANAAVAADTLPALSALRARFEIAGPAGERQLSTDEFFLGPRRTALEPGEILTAILVPLQPPHGAAFVKVGRRRAAAISRLSVAAMVNASSGMARLSIGAVFPKPRRIEDAEEVLHRGFHDAVLEEAGRAAEATVRSVSGSRPSMAYKLPVVHTAVVKALRLALAAGGEAGG